MAKKKHATQCDCDCCKEGYDSFVKKTNNTIKKYGWVFFFTPFEDYIDAKTLGLSLTYSHPELQIVLNVDYKRAHFIMQDVVEYIKKGNELKAGCEYEGLIQNFRIRVIDSPSFDGLRLIFPDGNGSFDNPKFKWQEHAMDPTQN